MSLARFDQQPPQWQAAAMPSAQIDYSDPYQVAGLILAEAGAFDPLVPAASQVTTRAWAQQIIRSGLDYRALSEGVLRVYAEDREPPKNKLGAIMAEARAWLRECRAAEREAAERARQASLPPAGWTGGPVAEAYAAHGAIERVCPTCGVAVGEWCLDEGRERKMPHFARLKPRPGGDATT